MFKRILVLSTLALCTAPFALAETDRAQDVARVEKAAQVFQQIMSISDHAIPGDLLAKAKCVAIVPGDKKFAFVFGGNYGRGVATCRTAHGWSAPIFIAIEGGSVGYQIGGSSTDLVLLFMNEHALGSLLSDKFKLGADASVAAGPVGRAATANTDVRLNAEILSYSRSKGLFAGVSLNGSAVMADKPGDAAMYGPDADRKSILDGHTPVPPAARALHHELDQYSR